MHSMRKPEQGQLDIDKLNHANSNTVEVTNKRGSSKMKGPSQLS